MNGKEPLRNGRGYSTDLYQLTKDLVDLRMKAYIVYTAEEHDQTRKEVRELKKIIKDIEDHKVHNILQDVVIGGLLVGMVLLLTGC